MVNGAKTPPHGRCLACGKRGDDPLGVTCMHCGSALSFAECTVCGEPDAKEQVFLRAAHYDFVQGAHRVRWRDHPIATCASCLEHVRDDDFKKLLGVGLFWLGLVLSIASIGLVILFELPKLLVALSVVFLVAAAVARIYPQHRVEQRFTALKAAPRRLATLARQLESRASGAPRFSLTASRGEQPSAR